MVGKQAPQATFLSSVAESRAKSGDPNAPKDDRHQLSPPQNLVLTILSQASAPVPKAILIDSFMASDLRPELCEQAVGDLMSRQLIADQGGYVLTGPGHQAAAQARQQLLSPL